MEWGSDRKGSGTLRPAAIRGRVLGRYYDNHRTRNQRERSRQSPSAFVVRALARIVFRGTRKYGLKPALRTNEQGSRMPGPPLFMRHSVSGCILTNWNAFDGPAARTTLLPRRTSRAAFSELPARFVLPAAAAYDRAE